MAIQKRPDAFIATSCGYTMIVCQRRPAPLAGKHRLPLFLLYEHYPAAPGSSVSRWEWPQ
jgi:hypothetical protein